MDTKITRDQFMRGMEAIARYRTMRDEVEAALAAGGCNSDGLAGDSLLDELVDQLSERCGDERDPVAGTMIGWVLWEGGGDITEADGTSRMVTTPEELWTYWETVREGPFSEPTDH